MSISQVQAYRVWWRSLAPSSLAVAAITGLIVWVAVADLLRQAPVLITIYVCIGTLQHANLRWTYGPAGRVIVSPANHRLHHAPDNQGVNLGVVLTVWDVLARRARFPARSDAAGRTGLAGRPVPVEQDDRSRPALVLVAGQLLEPFQTRR